MFTRLGRAVVRHRVAVLVATLVGVVVAGAFGSGAADRLTTGGFEDTTSESARARAALSERFEATDPSVVLLVTARDGTVDDEQVAAAGRDLTVELDTDPRIDAATSYWSLGRPPPLRSGDGSRALVLGQIAGTDEQVIDLGGEIAQDYRREGGTIRVDVGGIGPVFHEVTVTVEEDLITAESIALPMTAVLMVIVFGTVVAALLPVAVGIVAVVGTLLVLFVLAGLTEVSIFALNLTTALGLGLAIDYALLVVSRYREELELVGDEREAALRTVATAGRTVTFSAATVAASLAALLVFPFAFLRSFAYAGIAVVAMAAAGSVVVLPALLAVLGRRIERLRVRRVAPRPRGGGWSRVATAVMRRPLPIATAAVAFLVVLGAPFLRIELGLPDDRVLPPGSETRAVSDTIRDEFSSFEASPLLVVAPDVGDLASAGPAIDDYAAALSDLRGVARVDALTGTYAGGVRVVEAGPNSPTFGSDAATFLSIAPRVEPFSPEGEQLALAARDVPTPFDVLVGGAPAELVDAKDALFGRMPLALGVIAAVTFVVLFLSFGSILVPAKAIVLNLLSLSATFGAMVWVFQDGNLSGFLGFTPTGTITITIPILMFCIAFGLSMDYEVFLLARIKEEYDRTRDNERSVAAGLERTGRIVTAAAVLIAVVFLAFATSRVSFMKLTGIGLALAVLVDAFLVRATLVPAFMKLAGRANWWAPGPLRRLHERFGLDESGADEQARQPAETGA